MTEYTWGISALEAVPSEGELSNVVKTIHWTLTAVDGEYMASSYGSVGTSGADPADFTPYAELTEEQITSWLERLLDGDLLRAGLAEQIEAQINPAIVTPALPWA